MKLALICLSALPLFAGAEGTAKKPNVLTQSFRCEDGTNFVVTDLGPEAVVTIDDLQVRLTARKFAYGRRFVDDVTTLIIDGDKATVALLGSDDVMECSRNRKASRK